MEDDSALLKQFISTRDEHAFAALVRRYVDLVYSAARRQVRDDAAAQDVTQQVFVLLAEKANTIRQSQAIAGWLLVTTRFVALNSIRTESRRRRHEREAAVMHEKRRAENEPAWEQVGPMLDEAVARLKTEDRDALALRYFQGRSVADVAATMGVSQEAAQKRLSRAIERLRELFARRGVTTSADALSSLLMANALVIAPAALGSAVAGAALTAGAAAGAGAASGSMKGAVAIMALAKTKVVAASVAAVMLVGVTGTIAYQQFRAPGGKPRQVRVDPDAAAAASQALPPRQTYTIATADPAWRQRFDAVYRLKPSEALKRVPKPWIAERLAFYQTTAGAGQVDAIPRGPDTMLIAQEADGTLAWKQWSFGSDRGVRWALREAVGVAPQEVDLPPTIMAMPMPGDWVYRAGSTVEARMKDFAVELSQVAGRPYRFALQPREREAIVITGTYAFRPWPGAAQDRGGTMYLSLAEPSAKSSFSGAGGGTKDVFEQLGDLTNLPIILETTVPPRGPGNYKIDVSAAPYMDGRKPMDAATVDLLLMNLAKQTSLQLKREQRVVPTWVVVEGKAYPNQD